MKTSPMPRSNRRPAAGFTLLETLIASSIAVLLLAVLGGLSLYGSRSFAALANYVDLDNQNRNAVDVLSRGLRQATAVVGIVTNLPVKSISLTNAADHTSMVVSWNSAARTLNFTTAGQSARTELTGCDAWDFTLYQRTPQITPTNILVYPATNIAGTLSLSEVKVIAMSWRCSRTIMSQKLNTDTLQTAQIVLRNKQ